VEHFLSVGVLGQNSGKGGGVGGEKVTGITAAAEVRRADKSCSKHTSKWQPTV
jgi:hypothetical protein